MRHDLGKLVFGDILNRPRVRDGLNRWHCVVIRGLIGDIPSLRRETRIVRFCHFIVL